MRNLFLLLAIGLLLSCNKQLIEEKSGIATEQIINLKEKGALVVRLKAQEKKKEKLRERGLEAEAKLVEKRATAQNKEIMDAFKAKFDFCPVYFIDERGTIAIKNGEFGGNIYLNDNLEIDKSITCQKEYVLTAEYGQTLRVNEVEPDEKNVKDYKGGASEVEITGMIVKNRDFMPLRRPFPYYVKEFTAIILSRSQAEMVEKLNKNLTNFYKKSKLQ